MERSASRVVFTFPPIQVVGVPDDAYLAWQGIKDRTLGEMFAPMLDKIRATIVVETTIVDPDKGEEDETVVSDTDAGD